MINKYIPINQSIQNPDKSSINSKDTIDISVSNFDISASGYMDVVSLNFQETEVAMLVDNNTTTGSLYYTPIYVEKINYDVWKRRINKSFTELGIS